MGDPLRLEATGRQRCKGHKHSCSEAHRNLVVYWEKNNYHTLQQHFD